MCVCVRVSAPAIARTLFETGLLLLRFVAPPGQHAASTFSLLRSFVHLPYGELDPPRFFSVLSALSAWVHLGARAREGGVEWSGFADHVHTRSLCQFLSCFFPDVSFHAGDVKLDGWFGERSHKGSTPSGVNVAENLIA